MAGGRVFSATFSSFFISDKTENITLITQDSGRNQGTDKYRSRVARAEENGC